ncbi:methyl-accepting chemotaxis protein [Phytohalomonas tamaricis]|uniref:methyl-accepting chemotaxis protein n=1 Tax=Phytohalomonas tamaricis TaxID=2081032 RepID=UPI00131A2DC3|nr:methyl-accepting chemotaxis protein [Phytohalomonas tamaricis]
MQDDILGLAYDISNATRSKVELIEAITRRAHILSLNARIEAAHAGQSGAGFGVLAEELGTVSAEIRSVATALRQSIDGHLHEIEQAGSAMLTSFRGARLADLAASAVELAERSLSARASDVRWWATDSRIVDAAREGTDGTRRQAQRRLATILRTYGLYLDVWVLDTRGRVVATGRPERYPRTQTANMVNAMWFRKALNTANGDQFSVAEVMRQPTLDNAAVGTYATAIREGGERDGKPVGVLACFFDWTPQARAILDSVKLSEDERAVSRILLLDAHQRVLAASDGRGVLSDVFALPLKGRRHGFELRDDRLIAFARAQSDEGGFAAIEYRLPPMPRHGA